MRWSSRCDIMDFCVECGAEEDLFGHLCRKCLLSKDLVNPPKHVIITLCGGCGRVLRGSSWYDIMPEEEVERELTKGTRTRSELTLNDWQCPSFEPEKGDHALECIASFSIDGIEAVVHEDLQIPFDIKAKIRLQMCEPCSRQRSDYFEAIVQLRNQTSGGRSTGEGLETVDALILDSIEEFGRPEQMGFLTKSGKVKGGMDYYVGSVALARSVTRILRERLGATLTESKSLVGMKDGRDLYRWTILARLPSMKTGDVVLYENDLYIMRSVTSKNLTMKHLHEGRIRKIKPSEEPRLVAPLEDIKQAVVVSHDAKFLQILDPETMKTVTVTRPKSLSDVGETLAVVKYKDELYIVNR